ncbi:oligosaccharide flippase family protein [Paenilisteria rocourtiae]|uniref:O-antigen/teichoic acid export membrane protein n=2 Tax=Listeria rocourtiae TaxID=647910 RepID=A0A4R6ZQS7_9LIST|nr:oligosaccharide flippase family protein [Listeria rocourtiae]MBC1435750.1 oligosaccharide flippase family protein [Listeria rocourtiae]TDR54574.1 O-antigen/teichoic acid export membrane protein [Listeria rocourtiae]
MKKVTTNYIFVLLYQVLLIITPIFTMPYVIRVLMPENVGIEAYVSSIVQIFTAFATLGMGDYGRKVIASVIRKQDLKVEFYSLYLVQSCFSVIVLLIYLIFAFHTSQYQLLFFINILTILSYVFDITWFYTGQENMKNIMIRNMAVRLSAMIGIFCFVKGPEDLAVYVWINATTLLLGQLVTWLPLLRKWKGFAYQWVKVKKHVIPVMTFAIVPIITLIPLALNKVILGNITSAMDVGFYNQAFKLMTLFVVFVTALSTVMSPRMVKQYNGAKKEDFERSMYFSFRYVALSTLPLVTGLIAVAPLFIPLFLGGDFRPSILHLQILSPSLFFSGLAGIFGLQILVTTGKNKSYSLSVLIASFISFATNIVFIRLWGGYGTALSYITFTFITCVLQAYFSRKYFSIRKMIQQILPYVLASLLAFMFEVAIMHMLTAVRVVFIIIAQIVVGGIIYFGILLLFRDPLLVKIGQILQSKISHKKQKGR